MSQKEPGETGTRDSFFESLAKTLGLKPKEASLLKIVIGGVAIGVLFMYAGNLFGVVSTKSPPPNATPVSAAPAKSAKDELSRLQAEIAEDLKETLSEIAGAGKVDVQVTLEAGPTNEPIVNMETTKTKTVETTPDGSKRDSDSTTSKNQNVIIKEGSSDAIAVMKQSRAQIAGVLIVAEGASNAFVKAQLYEAATTALGVPAHKISVMPAGRR